MREPASLIYVRRSPSAAAFTSLWMLVEPGSTWAWRTRATSAGSSSTRRTPTSYMSAPWDMFMVRTSNVASTNPPMVEFIGPGSSIKDPKSAFPIWQSVPAIHSSCLPEPGTHGVLPGALMLRSIGRVAVCIVRRTAARPGLGSAEVACRKVTGDVLGWTSRPMASVCMRSFRQRRPASIVPMTGAIPGRWPTAIHVSPVVPGISIESPSTRTIPMCSMSRMSPSTAQKTAARPFRSSAAPQAETITTRSGSIPGIHPAWFSERTKALPSASIVARAGVPGTTSPRHSSTM